MAAQSFDPVLANYIDQAAEIVSQTIPGAALVVVSAYRSAKSQAALRARFLSGNRSGISSEPAAVSLHSLGRAVDVQYEYQGQLVPVAENPRDYWEFLAELLEPVGVRWGGRFTPRDLNHFDLPLTDW